MATWCIDPSRIVFAGHSDGGSVTAGLTVRETDHSLQPTHVVISAAGITAEDLAQEKCPAPLNVTLLHNPDDELFPAYGQGAAKWWGQCMQCKAEVITEASGCLVRQCAGQKLLRYCATSEPHTKWPSVTAHMFEWLDKDRTGRGVGRLSERCCSAESISYTHDSAFGLSGNPVFIQRCLHG